MTDLTLQHRMYSGVRIMGLDVLSIPLSQPFCASSSRIFRGSLNAGAMYLTAACQSLYVEKDRQDVLCVGAPGHQISILIQEPDRGVRKFLAD